MVCGVSAPAENGIMRVPVRRISRLCCCRIHVSAINEVLGRGGAAPCKTGNGRVRRSYRRVRVARRQGTLIPAAILAAPITCVIFLADGLAAEVC